MGDITVNDEAIDFDLDKMSITEYRAFAGGSMLESDDDALLAKVTGKTIEWVRGLPFPVYRRLLKAFFEKARAPLDNPN